MFSRLTKLCKNKALIHQFFLHHLSYIIVLPSQAGPSPRYRNRVALSPMMAIIRGIMRMYLCRIFPKTELMVNSSPWRFRWRWWLVLLDLWLVNDECCLLQPVVVESIFCRCFICCCCCCCWFAFMFNTCP